MNLYATLFAAVVAVVIAALWGAVFALRPRAPRTVFRTRNSRVTRAGSAFMARQRVVRTGIAVGGGLVTWLLTGWPIGGLAVTALVLTVPFFFGGAKVAAARIARLEALEQWVRHLSDTMSVGGMAVPTIIRSADSAPEAIRGPVQQLATRLATPRLDNSVALRIFADDIDDSLGDIVMMALRRAVEARGGDRVPYVLQALAEAVAAEVRARRSVEKGRSGPRKETQTIVILLAVGVAALTIFTDYPRIYSSADGQTVLLFLSLLVILALWIMRRLSVGGQPPRILTRLRDDERSR